jgi:hypothetical protein
MSRQFLMPGQAEPGTIDGVDVLLPSDDRHVVACAELGGVETADGAGAEDDDVFNA